MPVGSFFARHRLTPLLGGVALAVVSAAAPASAANKEHQQMMAEVRMLHGLARQLLWVAGRRETSGDEPAGE